MSRFLNPRLSSPFLSLLAKPLCTTTTSASAAAAVEAAIPAPSSSSAATVNNSDLPSLSAAESKLLDNLVALIHDHHRTEPLLPTSPPPPPDLVIPSLASSFANLSAASFPPSPLLARRLIDRLASLRHGVPFPQTLAFFNWWLSSHSLPLDPDSLAAPFAEMIDLCGKLRHFDIAWHLLDRMRALRVPVTSDTFASLIRRHVRAGLPEDAAAAFHRMSDYGCDPDPRTFSLLLAALSKKRLAAEAQSLFDSLKHRFAPDVVVYSALVHAWCRSGRIEEAERVFAEMSANGISPNVYTYTTVIDAMCRVGQIPRANELLCQMIDSGCPPNAATFNSLMRAHVKAGRSEQVLQVHNQMKQLGCEPDVITYNFLIETHCRKSQKNLDAALKVLNSMVSKGCVPDCHSFNPIFRCILNLGNINAAHKLYSRMRELSCKPNTVTYNLLMELFSKEKSMDMVLRIKKEMESEGVEPNVNTYGVLIKAFCERGNWKRAYGLLKEMLEEKCLKPTTPIYDMAMTLLRRAGQLTKHEELIEKMAERGFITRPL